MLNFNIIIFFLSLTMGVVLSLNSNNWISIWVGVELSMMSFLPLMKYDSKINSESCLKYFIFQSLSSSILLMGVTIISLNLNFNLVVILSLLIKLGVVPFHSWIMSIIDGMNFLSMMILFSLLKLAPLNLISYMNLDIQFVISFSLMVSCISPLNKNSFKKILCYSSIYNLSLMLICINDYSVWVTYMVIYSVSNFFMIFVMFNLNLKFINQVLINNFNLFSKLSLLIMVLGLGGLPPFMIFFGKMMIIESLVLKSNYMMIMLIIFSSLFSMFFYIRIVVISMTFFNLSMKWLLFFSYNTLLFMNILMIFFCPLLLTIKSLI